MKNFMVFATATAMVLVAGSAFAGVVKTKNDHTCTAGLTVPDIDFGSSVWDGTNPQHVMSVTASPATVGDANTGCNYAGAKVWVKSMNGGMISSPETAAIHYTASANWQGYVAAIDTSVDGATARGSNPTTASTVGAITLTVATKDQTNSLYDASDYQDTIAVTLGANP